MSSNRIKDQTKLESMQRRQFGRLTIGVLTVVGLAACGGGGGSGDDDGELPLRTAYERVSKGMTMNEVISIVGREADQQGGGVLVYQTDIESLMVHFGPYEDLPGIHVIGADWDTTLNVVPSRLTK